MVLCNLSSYSPKSLVTDESPEGIGLNLCSFWDFTRFGQRPKNIREQAYGHDKEKKMPAISEMNKVK